MKCKLYHQYETIAEINSMEKPLTFKDIYGFMNKVSNTDSIIISFIHEKKESQVLLKKDFISYLDFNYKFYLKMAEMGL